MSKKYRILISVLAFAALLGGAFFLSQLGTYGWTLFVLLPSVAGALGVLIFQPRTIGEASSVGAMIGVVGCALFLVTGREGLFVF